MRPFLLVAYAKLLPYIGPWFSGIKPAIPAIMMMMMATIEKPIRKVSALTVLFSVLSSFTRKNKPEKRLAMIASNRMTMTTLTSNMPNSQNLNSTMCRERF